MNHRLLMAALGLDGFAVKYGGGGFIPCWGCDKPARNGHCKKCQDKNPFVWVVKDVNCVRGRFRGKLISLTRSTMSRFGDEAAWMLRVDGAVLITFAGSIDLAREKAEKYLLELEAECKLHATL